MEPSGSSQCSVLGACDALGDVTVACEPYSLGSQPGGGRPGSLAADMDADTDTNTCTCTSTAHTHIHIAIASGTAKRSTAPHSAKGRRCIHGRLVACRPFTGVRAPVCIRSTHTLHMADPIGPGQSHESTSRDMAMFQVQVRARVVHHQALG